MNNEVKLYYRAESQNNTIGQNSYIGDLSRVRDSILGNYVHIDRFNCILKTKIGNYSYTGPYDMVFNAHIGNFVSISYGVTIGPPEHNYHRLSMHPFIYDTRFNIFDRDDVVYNEKFDKKVEIGNDVWIGCNSTILRGVKIGDGAIVGANSLVKHDVPPYAIVVGCPAKILKYRFSEEIIEELLRIEWWHWDVEKIKRNKDLFIDENINLSKLKLLL